jgi:hypothetical protein
MFTILDAIYPFALAIYMVISYMEFRKRRHTAEFRDDGTIGIYGAIGFTIIVIIAISAAVFDLQAQFEFAMIIIKRILTVCLLGSIAWYFIQQKKAKNNLS